MSPAADRIVLGDINVLMFCGCPASASTTSSRSTSRPSRTTRSSGCPTPTTSPGRYRLDTQQAAALVVGLRSLLEGGSGSQREVVERTLAKIEDARGRGGPVAERINLQVPDDGVEDDVRARLVDAISRRRQCG